MSRKLLPTQIVTYRKKIIYRQPENHSKNFFEVFFELFLITVLTIVVSTATAGVATSAMAVVGASQFAQALASTTIQTLINFSVSTAFDALQGVDMSTKNVLMNLLFSVTDIGKLGRAMKEDKLLKLLNHSDLLGKIGFKDQIKNFYKLKQYSKLKDVWLKNQTKTAFKKTMTDDDLLKSIFSVANSTLKKEVKGLSYDQLKTLLEIERIIFKINPQFIVQPKLLDSKRFQRILKDEVAMNWDDFLKMNDLEAVNVFFKLSQAKIGEKILSDLNIVRMQSRFQRNFVNLFKESWKNLKNKTQRINPFYWVNKFLKKMTNPENEIINRIREKTIKYLTKLPLTAVKVIKKYNLIPCNSQSSFLGYSFEQITFDGTGYLTIYKKPNSQKNSLQISHYQSMVIWTNLKEVEEFSQTKNQDQFYFDNWRLGFKQNQFKVLKLETLKVNKIIAEIVQFETSLKIISSMFETKKLSSLNSKNFQTNKLIKQQLENKLKTNLNKPIFTSKIIKNLKN